MFSRGLAVKIKQRNVFVAEEVIFFFFFLVLLCVLFFVAIEVNTGMFAH